MTRSRSRKDNDQTTSQDDAEFDELEPVMADDLDDLEPVMADDDDEDLEELDEWTDDDAAVEVSVDAAEEDEFDQRLRVDVGATEKSEIIAAMRGPLASKARSVVDQLRWQRVVVTFAGEAMIPSAVKEVVAAALADCKPLSVTVQRGYPDELVYSGELPTAQIRRSQTDASGETPAQLCLDVDTSGLDAEDLGVALAPEIENLCRTASGQAFTFQFHGGVVPEPAVYCTPLIAAGAARVVLSSADGEGVLFDRELEGLVTVSVADGSSSVVVKSGSAADTTLRAVTLVLTQQRRHITGCAVAVDLPSDLPTDAAVAALLVLARELKPKTMSIGAGEMLWPPVLQSASKGKRTGLRLRGAVKPGIAAAVRRELSGVAIVGQEVSFDWPEGAGVDAEVTSVLVAAGPASLIYTVAGKAGELVHPAAVSSRHDGDRTVCEIDTAVGKPAELVPAIQRQLRSLDLSGRKVDLVMVGGGMLTRTMRTIMLEALQSGGAAQGRLIEDGDCEFLFPDLLSCEAVGDDAVRLAFEVTDRTPEQVTSAFDTELQAKDLAPGTTVRVSDGAFVENLVKSGIARVVVEGESDLQVHPRLIAGVARDGDAVRIEAQPDAADLQAQLAAEFPAVLAELGDAAELSLTLAWSGDSPARASALERLLATGPALLSLDDGDKVQQLHPETVRSYVDVLGRRDSGTPAMLMLGIELDDIDGATAALGGMAEDLAGRRVLVVYRDGQREVVGAADHAVVQATRGIIDAAAAAVLQFMPKTRARPAHFEVVKSAMEGVTLGSRMRDPRG